MMITLACLRCKQGFEHDAQGGRRPDRCPPCRIVDKREKARLRNAAWRTANPERSRATANRHNRKRLADPAFRLLASERELIRKYGLNFAAYDALAASQDGKCAICRGGPNGPGNRLHVDHCHDSRAVRGLLCGKCNTAIGLLDNDPDRADALAAYLRR